MPPPGPTRCAPIPIPSGRRPQVPGTTSPCRPDRHIPRSEHRRRATPTPLSSALPQCCGIRRQGSTKKQLALRFIVHIVGDLHQPLHAGNGLDRGGNDLPVTLQGRRTNLHAVWDTDLVASEASWNNRAVQLATAISDEDLVAWWDPDPLTWIAESATLRDSVYPASQALGDDYLQRFRPVAELRLQQAGVRLAAYLNQLFAVARTHGAKSKSQRAATTVTRTNVEAGATFRCTPVRVWDGDGPLWCAEGPRLRLARIAAREIDESCRDNQPCPAASGAAARDALVGLVGTAVGTSPQGHVMVEGPPMTCTSTGTDNHDRTTAWCASSKGEDISCAMIANGAALVLARSTGRSTAVPSGSCAVCWVAPLAEHFHRLGGSAVRRL